MLASLTTLSDPSLSGNSLLISRSGIFLLSRLLIFVPMQMQTFQGYYPRGSFSLAKVPDGQLDSAIGCLLPRLPSSRNHFNYWLARSKIPSFMLNLCIDTQKTNNSFQPTQIKSAPAESLRGLLDEDDEACPVECVREFKTDEEFFKILEKAKKTDSLVVVDFYRTSCGSCKYIEQGFSKLCKGSGDKAGVIFLKHNVIDEYDEQSEVAERLRIKAVPLFHFYKDGVLLEAFPSRDKDRILSAILKHTSTSEDI